MYLGDRFAIGAAEVVVTQPRLPCFKLNLKFDREGKPRTAYSLRHTYICLRLIEGADIYALAKNCRTSVEMIQKFYASHIKDMLDASSINVRKPRKRGQAIEVRTD